jgi:hypothetical protein
MYDYSLFGGRLRSAIPFPELPEHVGEGSDGWVLDLRDTVPTIERAARLGELSVGDGQWARLYRHEGGFRIEYSDTGTFDVSSSGRAISWTPAPGGSVESARLDLIGIVMAVALHAAGVFTLHAGAVAVGHRVSAFIGPRRHGKSTLTAALIAGGARLVTDDSLAVTPEGAGVFAAPGVQSVRLWQDSFEHIPSDVLEEVASLNGKRALRVVGTDRRLCESAPLEAIYLLQPVAPHPSLRTARRTRLDPARAALVVAGHAKLAHLLGGTDEAATILGYAAAVAHKVPVYGLEVPRDLALLPRVIDRLLAWHPFRRSPPEMEAGGGPQRPGENGRSRA